MKKHETKHRRTNPLNWKVKKLAVLLFCGTQLFPIKLLAASFTIVNGQVETTTQSLANNETGTINTGGQLNVNGDAIVAAGNNTINNAGSISTTSDSSDGIVTSSGPSSTSITNSGSIITNGSNNANGILSQGDDDTIISSGTITTNGTTSRGIRSTGTNVNINHSGSITTQANQSFGIVSTGDSATITHTGTITTTGTDSDAIRSSGANASITSSGKITTSNTDSRGIRTTGTNASISQQGSITTSGQNAYGIVSTAQATITNTGTITTSGNGAHGIFLNGDDISVTNSGTISVSGPSAVGVNMSGLNGTLTNSGSIITSGNSTAAINGSGNNDVVTINSGSRIVGSIDLGAGTDTVNINGHIPYQTLSFTNVETINTSATYAIKNASTVTVIEPTRFVAETNAVGNFNSSIQQVLQQNMLNPIAAENTKTERYSHIWVNAFASENTHKKTTDLLGYTDKMQGVVAGFENRQDEDKTGYIIGYAKSETNVLTSSLYKDQSIQDSIFAGIYDKRAISKQWDFSMALMLGIQNHSTDRKIEDNLNGFETAKAKYSSTHIAPAISLNGRYQPAASWMLRPSLKAEAIFTAFDAYTETGTTASNLEVAKRSASTIAFRADLEAVYLFNNNKSEVSLSLGYDTRLTKSDAIGIRFGSGNLQFNLPGEDTTNGTYIGGRLNHYLAKDVELFGMIDIGAGDAKHLFAILGFKVKL